ncbi:MAG TPA: porin [Anaeromyxobacter sp.]|nr:porin [Anaeromyxobacter sp.]
MRTRLIASAISGLTMLLPFAAAAQQTTEVHIYGTLLPFLDDVRTLGATPAGLSPASGGATQVPGTAYTGANLPARFRISSGTSNIGFKGSLTLSDQLKVIWQVESSVSPDGDPPNNLAGRNTAVGLAGTWGTVFYGLWDTPYKYPTVFVTPIRGLTVYDNAVTANPGFNVPGTTTQSGRAAGKADAAFSRRQGNSVQYWSPTFYGLSLRLAASVNEGKTTRTATAPSIDPWIWSGLVTWESGPFGVRYSHERHVDYFGLAQLGGSAGATNANPHSHDDGDELIAWYAAPTGTKLSVIGERLGYTTEDSVAGAVDRYERYSFYALVQQRFGPHQLWGAFGRAFPGDVHVVGGGAATTNGLGASQWSLGYTYSLAKTADIYAAYYELANDRSGAYAVFPSPGTVAPGASTRGFGLGILYTFDASWTFPL